MIYNSVQKTHSGPSFLLASAYSIIHFRSRAEFARVQQTISLKKIKTRQITFDFMQL